MVVVVALRSSRTVCTRKGWRELKAHKGKKFEYFHNKPSWLPPIPNYFTGALK